MTVDDSLAVMVEIKQIADAAELPVLLGIATAFGCPYSGDVPAERVEQITARAVDLGVGEVLVADTTGMAHPLQVERLMTRLLDRFPEVTFALHFHNTRGMGLANVVAGLRAGVAIYDASVGGIGGCPFAPRATGNISTEDTVHMLHEMGVETGIDLDRLLECARLAERILGRELPGQVIKARQAERAGGRLSALDQAEPTARSLLLTARSQLSLFLLVLVAAVAAALVSQHLFASFGLVPGVELLAATLAAGARWLPGLGGSRWPATRFLVQTAAVAAGVGAAFTAVLPLALARLPIPGLAL